MTIYDTIAKLDGSPAPNVDLATGIHYGIIHQHDCNMDAVSDIVSNGDDCAWSALRADVIDQFKAAIGAVLDKAGAHFFHKKDTVLTQIAERAWDDAAECFDGFEGGGMGYDYEADGYKLHLADDGDIWVFESPYVTHCGPCSPCAPNAGYLTSPGTLLTYALGPDWFEDETPPYKVTKRDEVTS